MGPTEFQYGFCDGPVKAGSDFSSPGVCDCWASRFVTAPKPPAAATPAAVVAIRSNPRRDKLGRSFILHSLHALTQKLPGFESFPHPGTGRAAGQFLAAASAF